MQGHPEIIDALRELLRGELTARDQYFCIRGNTKIWATSGYDRINHEMEEEGQHADDILRRILFLGGKPDMRPLEFTPGETVEEMLRRDLELEYQVQENLKAAMALCERLGDYVTRDILLAQLKDTEEDHAYWLEQQLNLIKQMGLPNYLQAQVG